MDRAPRKKVRVCLKYPDFKNFIYYKSFDLKMDGFVSNVVHVNNTHDNYPGASVNGGRVRSKIQELFSRRIPEFPRD